MCRWGSCWTAWEPGEELIQAYPPKHADCRDSLPLDLETVRELYQPYVKEGQWTLGLLDMWRPKSKPVKRAVHIPCWDSCSFNPLKWRGIVLGRTCRQCYWAGMHETRWSRSTYSGALGRCYNLPIKNIAKSDTAFLSNTMCLCWAYFCLSCVFGLCLSQFLVRAGTCNLAAICSCAARREMRRKLNLPSTCCLPPYIDDFFVQCCCMYCASHQELRELAVRGIDGPGLFIMDVLPDAWDRVEGHEELLAARHAVLEEMLANPPEPFQPRRNKGASGAAAEGKEGGSVRQGALGWAVYEAPAQQEMGRVPESDGSSKQGGDS